MMTILNNMNMIDVAIVPHPFAAARIHRRLEAGRSIAEVIGQLQPDAGLSRYAHVYLNGDYVPQHQWPQVKPKAGTTVSIRMVPMGGGGGKNPLRTILSLAVMAASAPLATALGGLFGSASFMGFGLGGFITKGVTLLGRLALIALAPPPRPRFGGGIKESPTLFIQGARNRAYPFGRVPKVLGKHRFVPPFGALPYTETVGNEQYLRMLFVWGYGPLEISDLKIGETALSEFEGVQIETRNGHPDDAPITLYANSVIQDDLQVSLTAAAGHITRTTDTDAEEISVDITLPRGLFKFGSSGNKISTSVKLEVQYSPKGQSQWSAGADGYKAVSAQTVFGISRPAAYVYNSLAYAVTRIDRIVLDPASGAANLIQGTPFRNNIDNGAAQAPAIPAGSLAIAKIERRSGDAAIIPSNRITDERNSGLVGKSFQAAGDFLATAAAGADTVTLAAGGLQYNAIELTGKQSSALRKSVSFRVPKGQYDVRVRRLTADSTSDKIFDETVWTALRTIRYTRPVTMGGLAMTALRIKATDQLNGMIDRFNGVVHSILPDWNGSAWVDQVTSNPASLFRHVLQGNANARPLSGSRLDLAKIQSWHDACAAEGREFNAVIDYDVSVREVLQDIAAVGRASPSLIDGKWAVVEDKVQTVPIQHFTPRNTFSFRGEKSFDEIPEALRIRFINRDKGWLQDERLVFDDGFDAATATKYETLELPGVTSADQAWKDGRYHIATARLRPETYSFYTDIEHIVCTRGDLIRFTHDVPLFGLMSGRVKSLTTSGGNITAVTLDAGMPMWEEKNYAVRFRKSDGSSLVAPVATNPGTVLTLTFVTPVPAATGPAAGDLALFGESGQESVELIVKSIEPQSDLNARLTCVDADPAIHTASAAAMPAFSSVLTSPPEMQRPPTPVLNQTQSGLESMIRHADGSFTSRIVITLSPPVFNGALTVQVLIRAQDETDFRAAEVMMQGGNRLSITDVAEGEVYDIQLRYVTKDGALSAPLSVAGYRVEGTTDLPADVSGLNMNILGSTAYLSWTAVTDIDLDHYTLRYAPQTAGVTWGSAAELVTQIAMDATSISVPAASGTYLLKAVDVGGRQSANACMVISTIAGLAGFNAVLAITEDPAFSGAKSAVGASGGVLRLAGADSIDDWSDIDAVTNADVGNAWLAPSGTYSFAQSADLGDVYTSRLTAEMNVLGVDINNLMDVWDDLDGMESWDQAIDPSLWGVQLQLRTTNDDPAGSPAWSGWMPFVVGDYSARAYQFQAILTSGSPTVTPAISQLRVNIDMPDRTAGGRNITTAAGGSVITFATPFHATPAISVTAQNMATGDYYAITGPSASGFSIQFFNAGSTGISRTFDYLAKGYGEQI
jgi:hypothetical protein